MAKILFLFIILQFNFLLAQDWEAQIIEEDAKPTEYVLSKKEFTGEKILKFLFSGFYNSQQKKISWFSYPKENVPVSFDGLCYTNLDSILYYKNDTLNYALAIVRTVEHIDKDFENSSVASTSTIGLALFVEENATWRLVNFDRTVTQLGQMAIIPDKKIIQIGNNEFAISFCGASSAGGGIIAPEYEYWYRLNAYNFGEKIFLYYRVNTPDNQIIIERKIELIKSDENEFFDIIMNSNVVNYDSETTKIVKKLPAEKYHFEYGFNQYVLNKK